MGQIPREARDGLVRVWLAILHEKHPQLTWIAVEQYPSEKESLATIGDFSSFSGEEAVASDLVVQAA